MCRLLSGEEEEGEELWGRYVGCRQRRQSWASRWCWSTVRSPDLCQGTVALNQPTHVKHFGGEDVGQKPPGHRRRPRRPCLSLQQLYVRVQQRVATSHRKCC